jgi:hypothetical protein
MVHNNMSIKCKRFPTELIISLIYEGKTNSIKQLQQYHFPMCIMHNMINTPQPPREDPLSGEIVGQCSKEPAAETTQISIVCE